jgi:TolB-like protein/Tfp pilus assembly protein PilF
MNAVAAGPIAIYEFGNFRMDIGKRVLLDRRGTPISLTPKAYETLAYLVEHAGAVLDKEELLQAVWPDTAVEENNLTQNISQLRRILGERSGDHRYIVTVPGRGYEFVAKVKSAAEDLVDRQHPARVSVVVLPFVNVSADPELDYFCDGLAEELINQLSKLKRLRVVARTSAFYFKRKQVDIAEIAQKLNVSAVLEGSVRKSRNRVRIAAQLINAADGCQLWSERYDREIELQDIFEVQEEITLAVMQALSIGFAGGEESAVFQHHTSDLKAQELYLKGRFHLFRMTPSGIELGLSYFQQAIERDPFDAVAQVGLAHAYRMFALTLEHAPNEVLPKAKRAAEEALRLDPDLAEAHAVLAFNAFWHEWSWDAAEMHFRRALELNSASADTRWMYGHLLSNMGRHQEALAQIESARQLDPLSGLINAMEGWFLLHADRIEQAIARLRDAIALDPSSRVVHKFAASAYIEKDLLVDAIAETRAAQTLSPSDTHSMALEAWAQAKLGKRAEAQIILDQVLQFSRKRYVPPYHVAILYNGLNEIPEALAWLDRGFEQRDPKMTFLKVDPRWKNLHSEPRYQSLLARMQFVP